ncbi:MAG TPA: alpha/beta hydrolase [Candidatus Competibacteraceae bacterium]|nr:alpha/beta hydrolase [Candidatus Competibacteraceae bacterium]
MPDLAPAYLPRHDGLRLAYRRSPGRGPGVMFLGGFMSDMSGIKARTLEDFCRARGQAYVCFDYFGHGRSDGAFRDATVGRWREDALAVLDQLTAGPQILVGSSMGGWLMLLAALARPERVVGLVGIASAPDFTEDLLFPGLAPELQAALRRVGAIHIPSQYSTQPYAITLRLIEEARAHLLLRAPIPLACPVRLLHGMADPDVPWQTSQRLLERLESADVHLTLIKDGDHRLSREQDLALLCRTLAELDAMLRVSDPL